MVIRKIVVAHDLGKTNYGLSIVKGEKRGKSIKITVLRNGMLRSTLLQIKNGREHRDQMQAYMEENKKVIKKYKPDALVAERYQTRNLKGMTIELINMMLGALTVDIKMPYKFLSAVTWKRWVERQGVNLDRLYKYCKCTPHQVDATFLGIYALSRLMKVDKIKINVKNIMYQMERTSKSKLYNRVLRRK